MSDEALKKSDLLELEKGEREIQQNKDDIETNRLFEALHFYENWTHDNFVKDFRRANKNPLRKNALLNVFNPEVAKQLKVSQRDIERTKRLRETIENAWNEVLVEKPNFFQRLRTKFRG